MATVRAKKKKRKKRGDGAVLDITYITPFTDFGFKKLFGQEANKALLMDFLNELLPISDKIQDLQFRNNEQLAQFAQDRNSIFDIFCKDEKGNEFIVEMQNGYQKFFKDRTVLYSTFPLQEQMKKGKWNYQLRPVYCVGLLGFNLFDEPDENEEIYNEYLHVVKLKDEKNEVFYDKLTYIFIELEKFDKTEAELESKFDKWLYFLNHVHEFDEIPAILNEEIFTKAFQATEFLNFTREERYVYERSLKAFRDNINVIRTSLEDGLRKGYKRGIKQGIRQGKIEGLEQGKAEGLEQGKAEGLEQGKAEGLEQGKIEAAQILIETLKKHNVPKEDILAELQRNYAEALTDVTLQI